MNSKKIPSLFVELLVSFSIGPIVFKHNFLHSHISFVLRLVSVSLKWVLCMN